jgi:CHAT domain-containing protein
VPSISDGRARKRQINRERISRRPGLSRKLRTSETPRRFFFELANFYLNAGSDKTERLFQAHEILAHAQQAVDGDSAQAISLFEQSKDQFNQQGDEYCAAIAESWVTQMLRDVGKIDEARGRLNAIVASAESKRFLVLLPPAYYWLGMGEDSQRLLSDEARHLKTALRLAEAAENVAEIQYAEDALANNYVKLGEFPTALLYESKRLSDQTIYYQRQNPYWRDKGTLGQLTLKLGFPATSLSVAKEMLSFAEARKFDDRRLNDSLRHVVEASLALNDLAGALHYANQSLEIVTKRGDRPDTAVTSAQIYRLLGDINRQGNNCNQALADYDQALELYGRLPEVSAGAYQIHKGKLSCFQKLDDGPRFDGEWKVVMQLTEEYRQNIREDKSRQAFFDTEQDVFDAAVEEAIQNGDNRSAFAYAEESKSRSLLQFIESPKSIAEVETEFATIVRPLEVGELQRRLPAQVQLLQYAVMKDELAIWVVTKTRFDFYRKPVPAAELEKLVADYQSLIINKADAAEIDAPARKLYDLLIPPGLNADLQLCIAPDKFLHQLAFATLISNDGKYLLEQHGLSYTPSASILVVASEAARRKVKADERLLAVGNPDFDREANPNLPDLPDAEGEARTIADMYPNSILLVGGDAGREKFLRELSRTDVIHFAGHFVSIAQAPSNSKLLLARDDLRAAELASFKLPQTKLVILSACDTGFERYNRSEGSIGIARTFLALGAPIVVASQWKVDSATTRDLMVAFHRHRKQGHLTSAESLRRAQLAVLSKAETRAPFYWAAFSLFGGYTEY